MVSLMPAAGSGNLTARALVRRAALVAAAAAALVTGESAGAQALNYPAMQIPSVSVRDFSGIVAGSRGTMMMFQWREGISPLMHFGVDAGLYDPSAPGSNVALFFAGTLGYDLLRATDDLPLDMLLTAGVGASISDGRSSVRLPVGVSIGHTFELDQGMAITPFVHPRVSLDYCGSCSSSGKSRSDVSLNFDIGASFNINPRLSARAAVLFSGADQYGGEDAIAVGFTWTPDALRR